MTKIPVVCLALASFSVWAHANILTSTNYTFTGSEPDQTNRLSRTGTGSTWGSTQAFPGTIMGSYEYTTVSFNSGSTPELQISLTDAFDFPFGTDVYASLYSTFNPANIASGFLGDMGFSTNYQVFQVDGTTNTNYTLVLSEVSAGVQSGSTANVCVEGFARASSPAPTPACVNLNPVIIESAPEPATWTTTLVSLPMIFLAAWKLRKNRVRGKA